MRNLCLHLILINLFASFCTKKNPYPKKKDYFNCDYYNYFSDTSFPRISKKDSIDLIKFAIRTGNIKDAIDGKDTIIYRLADFIHKIKGEYDTTWCKRLDTIADEKKYFKSLEKFKAKNIIISEAVIVGQVIDKKYFFDTLRCLKFKVAYVIRVDEVLHTYFQLKKNDLVLVVDITGPEGGCVPKEPGLRGIGDHIREYRVNDSDIFVLWRWNYQRVFMCRDFWRKGGIPYRDNYCPNTFTLPIHNMEFSLKNEENYKDIKEFIKYWENKN